jgi:hypothetical protein
VRLLVDARERIKATSFARPAQALDDMRSRQTEAPAFSD